MKKLEIIIRPGMFDKVKDELSKLGIHGMNYSEIRGFGRQHGHTEVYRGTTMQVDCLPKIKIELVLHDEALERVLGAVVATAVITIVVLIFGEVSPKSMAKEAPEQFAMFSAPIIGTLMVILTPVNWFFAMLKKGLSKIMRSKDKEGITEEELENWTPEEYGPFALAILSTKSFEDGSISQVVAFGSAVSISDSLLSSGSFCNADYYLSVLNTLTHRENVISIQSKTLGGQELGLNTAQVFLIGIAFMIVVPVVVLICGMWIWYRRRNA